MRYCRNPLCEKPLQFAVRRMGEIKRTDWYKAGFHSYECWIDFRTISRAAKLLEPMIAKFLT